LFTELPMSAIQVPRWHRKHFTALALMFFTAISGYVYHWRC
jgi:hypothetical protein